MTDSHKIAIVNIVINVIIALVGWTIFIWAIKKTIQATLHVANPTAKPKRKRVLIAFERRTIKHLRVLQVCTIVIAILELQNYLLFNDLPPTSSI
jgi:hypothetical protein